MVRATQDPILSTKLNPPRIRSDIVKSHLKNVYGKLHVGNHRQAVIRAEEPGLR